MILHGTKTSSSFLIFIANRANSSPIDPLETAQEKFKIKFFLINLFQIISPLFLTNNSLF